eukprot:TRINITY_DN2429_c0_g1_i4.p1 TRINITY_DN2429_c0_g1~~TRINITY_DN2429_c0_g1_i4.p1  ORF type:complete len:114 (-),score=6.99 TRINITY_DN2429_c0_g1_i4:538-879(-)
MSDSKSLDQILDEDVSLFLHSVENALASVGVDVSTYFLDHMCYRIETEEDYIDFGTRLTHISELLSEAIVGGRKVKTFKLHEPYEWMGRSIPCLELPQPKDNSPYAKGFSRFT